jgi:signal transduction histidine kinase
MRVGRSLRLKFAATFGLAGVLLVLLLSLVIHQLNRHQELQLIDQIVSDEMESLLQQYERNLAFDGPPYRELQRYAVRPDTEALALRKWFRASWLVQGYIARTARDRAEMPVELRALAPGFHDILGGDGLYRVEVREIGEAYFYVAYSLALHQERERHFRLVLIFGALLTAVVTVLAGLWLSRRLTHQIVDLARRVNLLRGTAADAALAPNYPEREVAELAAAFDAYHLRMTRLLDRERAFTADVSHELRTPLTAIQTGCELLLEDGTLSARSRTRVEKITAAAARLTELVNAFLLMAREEADGIQGDVDLRECAEEAAESVRERAEAKGLALEVDVPDSVTVRVPQRALHVVLSNLLANAVRYTEQGTVRLRSRGSTVEILDTGCGIEPGKVQELFRRFNRGDVHGGDGYGLGLSIVKRICEQAGWDVGIERRREGGTRVYLALEGRFHENLTNP